MQIVNKILIESKKLAKLILKLFLNIVKKGYLLLFIDVYEIYKLLTSYWFVLHNYNLDLLVVFAFIIFLTMLGDIKLLHLGESMPITRFLKKLFVFFVVYPLYYVWKVIIYFVTKWFNKEGRRDKFGENQVVSDFLATILNVYTRNKSRDKNYISSARYWKHFIYLGFITRDIFVYLFVYIVFGFRYIPHFIIYHFIPFYWDGLSPVFGSRFYVYTLLILWFPVWFMYFNYWYSMALGIDSFWFYTMYTRDMICIFKGEQFYKKSLYLAGNYKYVSKVSVNAELTWLY